MIWEALRHLPPELQAIAAAICLFNFGLWAFLMLAIHQLRASVQRALQTEQLILEKELQIMADQTITKAQFLAAIQAAVADLKTNFSTALDTEKAQIIAVLEPIVNKGELLNGADLAGVLDLIKGVGTTALPKIDSLSDSVAAALQTTTTGGGTGGGGQPQP